ncbi:hypothetical protein KY382_24425 [Pseudomonas monteilii]|nr:hypothetical protein [Pseudomonas monteilii]
MGEKRHTPGPWVARPVPNVGLRGHTGYAIDFNEDQEQVVDFVYEEADARLIAAAPDLLEALESCIEHGSMTGAEWVADKARAAVAKATS